MKNKPFAFKLFVSFTLLTVSIVTVISIIFVKSIKHYSYTVTENTLKARSFLIQELLESAVNTKGSILYLSQKTNTRITLVNLKGTVISDSRSRAETMDNHANRPEINKALNGQIGVSIRYSNTLKLSMMYLALPPSQGIIKDHIIRVAIPIESIHHLNKSIINHVFMSLFLILCISLLLSFFLSNQISSPLRILTKVATHFSQENFSVSLPSPKTKEEGILINSIKKMSILLKSRFDELLAQKKQQEVIFENMVSGVLLVDSEQHVISINSTAHTLLNCQMDAKIGAPITSYTNNDRIHEFIQELLAKQYPLESEITINTNQTIQISGVPLFEASGFNGSLIVLQDITRLKNLEKTRKEFVANVSHELKTPITLIKGGIETLQQGALQQPDACQKFFTMIGHHSNRLDTIINDLLQLSTLEGEPNLEKRTVNLTSVIATVLKSMHVCAKEKHIDIIFDYTIEIESSINQDLIQQALLNLVENAIKYSHQNTKIHVQLTEEDNYAIIHVQDEGFGIEESYHEKIFERFYRVDPTRSRDLGGTGLGLAIAKHITNLHNGKITIQSELNKGSIFSLYLPIEKKGIPVASAATTT